MIKIIEIDEEILRDTIKKIDSSLDFKKAKELIEKVQERYVKGMSAKKFKSLVNGWRRILNLSSYNYSLVAFSYLSKNKRSTEYLQKSFSL